MATPQTIKELHEEMQIAYAALREYLNDKIKEVKSNGAVSGETEQKLDRVSNRLDEIEVALKRPGFTTAADSLVEKVEREQKRKAFVTALKVGISGMDQETKKLIQLAGPDDTKALSVGDETLGGYLAPPDFIDDIIKSILLISPVRQYATVRQTTKHSIRVPYRNGVFAAQWVGETAQRSETTGLKYGQKEITTNELYAEVLISQQMLEDAAFDMDQQIQDEATLQFQIAEGKAFVSGDGNGKPEGFMTSSLVTGVTTSAANTGLDYASLVDFIHSLKSPYAVNATWFMNRKSVGAFRKLVDSQNRPLWEPSIAPGNPPTIMGYSYAEVPDMSDISATAYPIAFGDWKRAYWIVDRVNVVVQRLVEKYAEQGQIAYLIRRRTGGQVVLPEAIVKYQIHA